MQWTLMRVVETRVIELAAEASVSQMEEAMQAAGQRAMGEARKCAVRRRDRRSDWTAGSCPAASSPAVWWARG